MPGHSLRTLLEQIIFFKCGRATLISLRHGVYGDNVLCVLVKSTGEVAFQHSHLTKGPAHLSLAIGIMATNS